MNNTKKLGSTTTLSGEEESEPSHPPLVNQSLRDSFIEVGSRLHSSNPELFINAIQQLSTQFTLVLAKNPEVLSSSTPGEHLHQRSHMNNDQRNRGNVFETKRSNCRRYVLPGDANKEEFYQCMVCKERRQENSFQSDHIHFGKKPKIRWYCPICKTFLSVTHRSGHIKNRHLVKMESDGSASPSATPSTNSIEEAIEKRVAMIASAAAAAAVSAMTQSSSPPDQPLLPDLVAVKKEEEEREGEIREEQLFRESHEEESQCYLPAEKRMHFNSDDQDESTDSSSSPLSAFSPLEGLMDPTETDGFSQSSLRTSNSLCPFSDMGYLHDDVFHDIPPF